MNEELKKVHELLNSKNRRPLVPATEGVPSIHLSWNNFYGSWSDGGWNNFYGSWSDGGWNNFYGSWSDAGWNNFYGSWSDAGWNNFYGSWGDGGDNGGGCFLTTACVNYKQLPDDCYELQVLRAIRDTIVDWDEEMREMVLEYYRIAPAIVTKINEQERKDEIWAALYDDLVTPCVRFYEKQEIDKAVELYINTVRSLKEKYLDE